MEYSEKQIHILQVAEKLFAEKGFDGTSIRDISKEAKINIAMVSYYFGSKEKMLEALILSRSGDMQVQLENIRKENLSHEEKLDRLIDFFVARVHKNRRVYQIIHFEYAKNRSIDFEAFKKVKTRNVQVLKDIIAKGQEDEVFRKDVVVELIPTMIIGTCMQFHLSQRWYRELLDLKTERDFENYIKNELTTQIKRTIKAFLKNEN